MDYNYHQKSEAFQTTGSQSFPAAENIEQSVLAGCIIRPGDFMPQTFDDLTGDDFYLLRHQTIWDSLKRMWFLKLPIELPTLAQHLMDAGEMDKVSVSYLSMLINEVPASVDISHHVNILKEKRALRQSIEYCNAIIKRAMSNEPALETVDRFVEYATGIQIDNVSNDLKNMDSLTHEMTDLIDAVQSGNGALIGIDTGFVGWNKMTHGFQRSDLCIIAARPSMGKTSLGLNMLKRQAKKHIRPAMFSLEMPARQLYMRMLADESEIDSMRFFKGGFSVEELDIITDAQALIYDLPILIDDKAGITVEELCSRARKYKAKHSIDIIYIDHLQLVDTKRNFYGNRNNQLGYITIKLKTLAKDLDIPIVCFSQLNRNLENRPNPNKRPRLSDLRDSGNIEQDADLIGFIYRPEVYGDTASIKWPGYTDVYLGKNRNGPCGSMELSWNAMITRFYEVDPRYAGGYAAANPIT